MLRQIARTALAASAALVLAFCFISGAGMLAAWVALVPLILAVEKDTCPAAFMRGVAAGFFFFLLTLFWIHHVTIVGLLLLCAYLALYWGLFAAGVALSARWPVWARILFGASLWTALEYLRANAFTGFGWSALAQTQSNNILFIQIADIVGTYGLSWLMAAVSLVAALWVRVVLERRSPSGELVRVAAALLVFLGAVLNYGVWQLRPLAPVKNTVRVALVQANMSLVDYWDPRLKAHVVEKHLKLSQRALAWKPELVIWPETAFPQFIWEYPELMEKIRAFAQENKVAVMFGAVTREGEKYFNAAILISAEGEMAGEYRKEHLVVLGEYIPFRRELPFLERFVPIDDFTPGHGRSFFALAPGKTFAPVICFEDTLPELSRQAAAGGAGFLVNITNDAWFRDSWQPRMHLENAVFRAIETRLAMVRATNTGMTCGIMPTGEVAGCVRDAHGRAVMVEGVSVLDVPVSSGSVTFYTKYGDLLVILCFPVILGMMIFRWQQEVRDGRP